MVRQREPTLAKAARLSVREPARALQLLPVIEEKDAAARHARMARDFGALSPSEQAQTLLLTGSHEARRDINERVRAELRLAGSGERVRVFRALDMTAAQKKQLETYQPGLAVRFEKDYRSLGVRRGDTAQVERVFCRRDDCVTAGRHAPNDVPTEAERERLVPRRSGGSRGSGRRAGSIHGHEFQRRLSEQGARRRRGDQRRRAGDTAIGWQHFAACPRSGVIARLQLRGDRPQRARAGRIARHLGEGHALPHDTPSVLLYGSYACAGCGCRRNGFDGAARAACAFGPGPDWGLGSGWIVGIYLRALAMCTPYAPKRSVYWHARSRHTVWHCGWAARGRRSLGEEQGGIACFSLRLPRRSRRQGAPLLARGSGWFKVVCRSPRCATRRVAPRTARACDGCAAA